MEENWSQWGRAMPNGGSPFSPGAGGGGEGLGLGGGEAGAAGVEAGK